MNDGQQLMPLADPSLCILVISSDPTLSVSPACFTADPHFTFTLASATTATALYQQKQPDGLLLDLDLPELHDPQWLATLCAATAPTPLFLFGTANTIGTELTRLTAYGNRIVDWLRKPLDTDELRLRLSWRLQQTPLTETPQTSCIATLCHGIRAPLSSLIGIAEVLEASPLSPRQQALLTTLHQSALHLLRRINELLDYAKIEAGQLALEAIPFSPQTLLHRVHATLLPLAEKKHLQLNLHLPNTLPQRLRGDPLRLQQVLLNLGHNGIKFTEHGAVSLAVNATPEAQGCRLNITITDTGIGIPADLRERLFDPFQQTGAATGHRSSGTGLSLMISERLIRQMGGPMQVHSQPGAGSTFAFSLWFPLADAAERDLADNGTVTLQPDLLAQRSILVVEDFLPNREILTLQLQSLGCVVECAENGLDAIERAGQHRYDAILMDLHMPRLDGIEAARRIRRQEAQNSQPPVPIIAVTADAQTQERQQCFDVGMNDYLIKPYRKQTLATVLLRWLPTPADNITTTSQPFQQLIDDLSVEGAIALFQTVLTHTPPQLERLIEALQQRDWPRAGQVAHRLKGTARFYSDPQVHALLEQVDTLSDHPTDADDLAHTLQQAYQHIFWRLRQEISRLGCTDDMAITSGNQPPRLY